MKNTQDIIQELYKETREDFYYLFNTYGLPAGVDVTGLPLFMQTPTCVSAMHTYIVLIDRGFLENYGHLFWENQKKTMDLAHDEKAIAIYNKYIKGYNMKENANANHMQVTIDEMVNLHEKWAVCAPGGVQADFSLQNLEGVKFINKNLAGAVFYNAHIGDAQFSNCNLEETDFIEAYGERPIFNHCDIQYANFGMSNFVRPSFEISDLEDSNFRKASMVKANFQGSELEGTDFRFTSMPFVNWKDTIYDPANYEYPGGF